MKQAITNRNIRRGILPAFYLLFALHLSAHGAQPALVNTMSSIGNALNNRGAVSWTETFPSLLGLSYKITGNLKEVTADPSACSLRWTSVYTSSEDDKLVETILVRLEMISSVRVQPYSTYLKSQTEYKFEVSPEIYIVEIETDAPFERHRDLYHKNKLKSETKPPSDRVARVVFADEQTANKVMDGIREAANSCKASRSSGE
jgi:hypothetical protein